MLAHATELHTYEAITLGFAAASFGHQVQFLVSSSVIDIITDPNARAYGLLKSYRWYDVADIFVKNDDDLSRLTPHFGDIFRLDDGKNPDLVL